ncbi:hypothetical protein P8452_56144 [Trifolium repens]|nr:hypothetical protein P8452_56144 [Trifolium repens]
MRQMMDYGCERDCDLVDGSQRRTSTPAAARREQWCGKKDTAKNATNADKGSLSGDVEKRISQPEGLKVEVRFTAERAIKKMQREIEKGRRRDKMD